VLIRNLILFLGILILWNEPAFSQSHFELPDSILEIKNNWQYLISGNDINAGQSEIDEITASDKWVHISSLEQIPKRNDGSILWLKTKIPDLNNINTSLYLGLVEYSIKVYLGNEMIYQWGCFDSSGSKYMRMKENLIPLPNFKKGTELYFQIKMGKDFAGIHDKILLGSTHKLLYVIFIKSIVPIVSSILIFIIGITVLLLRFILPKTNVLFGLSIFLIFAGILIAVNNSFLKIIFNKPVVFYHLNYISFNMASIAFYFLMEKVVAENYKKIINILWKMKIGILVVTILLLNLTSTTFFNAIIYMSFLNISFVVIGITTLLLSIKQSSYESKIFIIGSSGIFFSVIIQFIIILLNKLNEVHGGGTEVFNVAAFMFMISIIWLTVHNYLETYKQKEEIHQKEIEAVQRENEARYLFSAKLIEYQENERNRIALELHDSVGQKLLLIKNQLLFEMKKLTEVKIMDVLQNVTDLTGDVVQEIRNITHNLHPQYLDQLGLTVAIETMIEKIADSSQIDWQVNVDNIDDFFSKSDEVNFFRIIQESLNNIVKHARTAEVFINIKRDENSISMEIKDNGIGLINDALIGKGLGIAGMKERARILEAEFDMVLGEKGTTIKMKCNKKTNTQTT
jgi:signal transduction histidine kinase